MTNYVNLHQHTDHSLLDGYSTVEDYASRCKEIGMTHLTTTDHGTLTNARKTIKVAKANGLIPIIGMEAYYTHDATDRRPKKERTPDNAIYYHLTMIAKNENGLKNLQGINDTAWSEGYFYMKPRLDLDLLDKNREDLIVASACLGGVLCKSFERGDDEAAYEHASQMKEIFGDNYYIEVMSPNGAEMNNKLLMLADTLGIKPIVTDDCHHARPEDAVAQDALLIMQTKEKVTKNYTVDMSRSAKMELMDRFNYLYPDRFMTFKDLDLHLKDGATHQQNFEAQGIFRDDITENTRDIADSIGEYPFHQGLDLLPRPKNVDPDKNLRDLVYAGLVNRGVSTAEYKERANHELKIIADLNFSTYFLLTKNILDKASELDMLAGFGRGSAAGSLVCYALGITHADPIEYGLLFSRFLDPSRSDYPDIDNDVPDSRRAELLQYVKDTFTHVGNLMTFSQIDGKSLFKDVCRVLKLNFNEIEAASKLLSDDPNINGWEDYKESSELADFRKKYPEVEFLGDALRGRTRQRGIHASGVVISKEPISNFATIESATNPQDKSGERISVVGLNMHDAADLGFIKMDFLGLKALGIVDDIIKMVDKRHGHKIDVHKMKFNDPRVFASIRKGNTAGIFQIEGSAFTNILNQMPIEEFNDIVAGTSLIRPGAADSRFGKQYLDFRNKGKVHKVHRNIDPFLSETGGAVLYQEQLMQACVHLAGMTDEESNEVRRAVGKKDAEKLALWRNAFIAGATETIGEKKAKAFWKDVEASAKYSFNKSHAVTYSMLTYAMAFLKHYYPLEFYTCVLAREKDADKKVEYLIEAKRNGIRILVPHVNSSDMNMSISKDDKGDHLRMGLVDIKNVGLVAARKIIARRPFYKYEDLLTASAEKYSGINTKVLASLNAVGAASFSDNPLSNTEQDNYYEYLNIPLLGSTDIPEHVLEKISLLDDFTADGVFCVNGLVSKVTKGESWARADLMDDSGSAGVFFNPGQEIEKGMFGIFLIASNSIISYLPVDEIATGDKPLARYMRAKEMAPFKGRYRVVGLSPRKTKKGDTMGTLVLTDDQGVLKSIVVFPGSWPMTATHAKPGALVRVRTKELKDGSETLDYIAGV